MARITSLASWVDQSLCPYYRAMQPPHETHYALARDARGWLGVSEVETARVYHVNSILELRTQACPH
jgi:hypothetical protein